MISELRLTNFQGFKDTTKIPLAPITLIFGPNSSGKSSIIRSLLLFKQSTSSVARETDRFSFVDSDVDLGGFANVVHRHNVSEDIGIGITFTRTDKANRIPYGVDFAIREGDIIGQVVVQGTTERMFASRESANSGEFTLTFDNDPDSNDRLILDYSKSRGFETIYAAFGEFSKRRVSPRSRAATGDDPEENVDEVSSEVLKSILLSTEFTRKNLYVSVRPSRQFGFSKATENSEDWEEIEDRRAFLFRRFLDELLSNHVRRLDNNLRSITHLAGLRVIPDRFSNMGSSTNKITADASNIVTMLGSSSEVVKETSKWLSRLTNGAYELEVIKMNGRSIDFLGDVGSLVLRDTRLNTTTTFKDVGVGLSQVLPIIAALVQSSAAKAKKTPLALRIALTDAQPTLLLEQPELHLHPKMQAELADLLIERSLAKSPDGPQIVMETHSENIILRMQRRIREGKIPASMVSVVYVDRDPDSGISRVKVLPLDDNGEFLAAWPEDFGVIRLDEILP